MGKHLWISSDPPINLGDKNWTTTSIIFHNIFDCVALYFKPHEMSCKDMCYEDRGVDGIDLSDVDKECFNIFYIRCKEALVHHPCQKLIAWLNQFTDQPAMWDGWVHGIAREWKEILKRLELDKRFDAAWIEDYERKCNVAVAPAVPANKTD